MKRMKILGLVGMLVVLLAACGGSGDPQTVEVEVTRLVTVESAAADAETVEVTREVTVEVEREVTTIVEKVVTATPEPATATPEGPETAAIGDRIERGDYAITVNEVATTSDPLTEFGDPPPDGTQYVVVDVTIENIGGEIVSYNRFDITVRDDTGLELEESFGSAENQLSSGELAPGDRIRGRTAFESVPGTPLTLVYAPSDFMFNNLAPVRVDLDTP